MGGAARGETAAGVGSPFPHPTSLEEEEDDGSNSGDQPALETNGRGDLFFALRPRRGRGRRGEESGLVVKSGRGWR